jgi:hypothetical protein
MLLLEFQDDLKNSRWRSYSTLNLLKWIKNFKKLWGLKVGGVQREEKRKKFTSSFNFLHLFHVLQVILTLIFFN